MDSGENDLPVVQLNFALLGLSGRETVVLRLPDASGASLAMLTDRSSFEIGVIYGDAAFSISELVLQPQRLFFTVTGAPPRLPLILRVRAPGPFLYGSLQVGETVETIVSTAAERVRILGPGYWAVPVPLLAAPASRPAMAAIARAAPRRASVVKPAPTRQPPARPPATTTSAKPPPAGGATNTKAK